MGKILIVGGSGFLSGTMVRRALLEGHEVHAITRGQRPMPAGVNAIVADRKDPAEFAEKVRTLNIKWDLVVDCIGFLIHFLHLFHRNRIDFLNAYQSLVLADADSSVSVPLKTALLSLRLAAESEA